MSDDIISKFPSLNKELASDIIDIIATSVVDDEVSLTLKLRVHSKFDKYTTQTQSAL